MTPETAPPRTLSVSLVLPVLNHEERLTEVLEQVRAALPDGAPEVIVVYDVTQPRLLDEVKAEQRDLEQRYGIRTVTRTEERGFGSALRAGFEASSGDVIIPVMADCSDDISAIPRMLEEIRSGADIVAGSRYMPGGRIVGDTPKQQLSRLYSVLMRVLTGLSCQDVSNSFKAYRREVWANIPNESNSFDISVEMTLKGATQGYRVAQVPSVWTNRQVGRSQFGMMKEFRNYARWLLYAARRLPSRFFMLLAALGAVTPVLMDSGLRRLLLGVSAG